MKTKILIVEDEEDIREMIAFYLTGEGYTCDEANNGEQGLDMIMTDPEITIVLSDILMPKKSGLEMIAESLAKIDKSRQLEFVIMTGHGGADEAIDALKLGVMDFIQKPFQLDYLSHVIGRADELVNLKRFNQNYQVNLEQEVQAQTLEIQGLLDNLEGAHGEALACLAMASEYKDTETGNHIRRIGEYAALLSKNLGWSEARQNIMRVAAPLHDAGKIGTPDNILLKPGRLDPDEIAIMKQHVEHGCVILSQSTHPTMKIAANIALAHHETWDGSGYPKGLKGTEIPIEARIVALADVYDALRSERSYKPAFDHEKSMLIILKGDGRTLPEHFDPELLRVFAQVAEDMDAIFSKWED
ncbi:MAG: response regulator rpfG [Rhodospirillaceae bacterium]|nr:MAG: response regulator rpfG [Rhodospirillaceae bacterium]